MPDTVPEGVNVAVRDMDAVGVGALLGEMLGDTHALTVPEGVQLALAVFDAVDV